MDDVYITAMGKFLPGPAITNDEMEDYLGRIGDKPSRARRRILKQNGIVTRHYALDKSQRSTHRNSEMAALAVRDALSRSEILLSDVQLLATATTAGDVIAPGFASMVQGELAGGRCELASLSGICASGMMALKTAYLHVRCGEKDSAVACASEFPSRLLKASHYETNAAVLAGKPLPYSSEFLRWMLSDGAGAAVLRNRPAQHGLSLHIDWIDIRSYAHQHEVCMSIGGSTQGNNGSGPTTWMDYDNVAQAAAQGAFDLNQDVRMLDDVVKVCVDGFLELIEQGRIDPSSIDWMLCHYSSHVFRERIFELLSKAGIDISAERWFTNLYTKGNVGCASLYLLLEELLNEGRLEEGQKVLCVVPESGRFMAGYMMLTVVGSNATPRQSSSNDQLPIAAPALQASGDSVVEGLVRDLARVWIDFEGSLRSVPIVQRIERGTLTIEQYRQLLLQMRQQVVEGSRWIARAASNVNADHFSVRSAFLQHAVAEHRDFQLLESDFVSCGGSLEEIQSAQKNVGSEALSAWMFHQASQPDPFDLLGAMFIIEGLGVRVAGRWARAIRRQLGLTQNDVRFLAHHGAADEDHFHRLEQCLESGVVTPDLAARIVRTARVTARLYRLQLEEITS